MGRNNLKLYGVGNALLHYREKKDYPRHRFVKEYVQK